MVGNCTGYGVTEYLGGNEYYEGNLVGDFYVPDVSLDIDPESVVPGEWIELADQGEFFHEETPGGIFGWLDRILNVHVESGDGQVPLYGYPEFPETR